MTAVPKPVGLSVFEGELFEHIIEHLDTERGLLETYQHVAEESRAEYVAYLLHLIIEDEIRHHRLFEELANALRAPVERDVGPRVPMIEATANARALLEVTERLLDAEQEDERELERLSRSKALRQMRGLSLWPLLLDLMEHDTKKHQMILRFLRKQLRADPASRGASNAS